MAQPTQITTGLPNGDYSVIDNGAPGNNGNQNSVLPPFTGTIAGAGGYDNAANGAIDQNLNFKPNGTIPDFVKSGNTLTVTAVIPMIISYKLPS